MQYTNPRFQSMSPNYQTYGSGQGSPSDQIAHPAFQGPGEANIEAQANQEPFVTPYSSRPMVNPRFQQWAEQAYPTLPSTVEATPAFQGAPGVHAPFVGAPTVGSFPGVSHGNPAFEGSATVQNPNWGRGPGTQWTPEIGRLAATPGWRTEQGWPTGTYGTLGSRAEASFQQGTVRQPAVDVFDEGESLIFEVELPGVSKDVIDLVCDETSISLKATAAETHEEETIVQSERGNLRYQRTIPLGVEILPDDIEATFSDGVLTLTCPKKEPTSGLQKVEIK